MQRSRLSSCGSNHEPRQDSSIGEVRFSDGAAWLRFPGAGALVRTYFFLLPTAQSMVAPSRLRPVLGTGTPALPARAPFRGAPFRAHSAEGKHGGRGYMD